MDWLASLTDGWDLCAGVQSEAWDGHDAIVLLKLERRESDDVWKLGCNEPE